MPAISATAPGKIILFGEHAVVYGQPAIAAPVTCMRVKVYILAAPASPAGKVRIEAPALPLDTTTDQLQPEHPIHRVFNLLYDALGISAFPAMHIKITSTIPKGGGMGSSAAVSVALARGLSSFVGLPLPDQQINQIAYEVEKYFHGTPSGIDNTVITYARPVYFVRGQEPEFLSLAQPLTFVIADSGIQASTAHMVGKVRLGWQENQTQYESWFAAIGKLVHSAKQILAEGSTEQLASLINENHQLLKNLGVSLPHLDQLVTAALENGALAAKLSGGGGGGNIIALTHPGEAPQIAAALERAGAARTWITTINSELHPNTP
ncbi:MAG: mevalonate kinase [Bellilinea sp.]|jgi:mevalonate kinase